MLYSNQRLIKEEKNMKWGILKQFGLEEFKHHDDDKFVFPTNVRENEIKKGFNRNLVIGETKKGAPRINFDREDKNIYLMLSADRILIKDIDIPQTKIYQSLNDYKDGYSYTTNVVLRVPYNDFIIGTQDGSAVQLYYCHDQHVYETTPDRLESLCVKLGTDLPCKIQNGELNPYEFINKFESADKYPFRNLAEVVRENPYAIMFIKEPSEDLCEKVKFSAREIPDATYLSELTNYLNQDDTPLGNLAVAHCSAYFGHLQPEEQEAYLHNFSSWDERKQYNALSQVRDYDGFLKHFPVLTEYQQAAVIEHSSDLLSLSCDSFQKIKPTFQKCIDADLPFIYDKLRRWRFYDEHDVKLIKEMTLTPEQQNKMINQNGAFIQTVEHPTEEQQLIAVKSTPSAIQYLDAPSEAVMQQAVKGDKKYQDISYWKEEIEYDQTIPNAEHLAITYIPNPSEAVQLIEVENIPENVCLISNPTEAVKKLALEKDPSLVRNTPFDIHKDLDLALEANLRTAKYMPEYNQKTVNKILDLLDGSKLSDVVNKNAIKINEYNSKTQQRLVIAMPELFKQIESPTHAVQVAAVKASQDNIQYIEKQTEPIQMAIIERGYPLSLIKNPSEHIQEKILEKDYSRYFDLNRDFISEKAVLAGVRGILNTQEKQDLSLKDFVQYPQPMQRAFLISGMFEIENERGHSIRELNITADIQRMLLNQNPELDIPLIKLEAGVNAKQAIEWNPEAKELMKTRIDFLDSVAYPSEYTYEESSGWRQETVTKVLDLNQYIKEHGFEEKCPKFPSPKDKEIHRCIDEFKDLCAYYQFSEEQLKDFQPRTRDLVKSYMETEDYEKRSFEVQIAEYAAAEMPVSGSYLLKTDHSSLNEIQITFCMNPQEIEKAFGPIQSPEDLLAAAESLNRDEVHESELSKEEIIRKVAEQSHLNPSHLKVDDQNIVRRTILTQDGLMDIPMGRFENGTLNKEYSMKTEISVSELEEDSLEQDTDLSEQDSFDTQEP